MAEEKKLAKEMLSDTELDGVVGGTTRETRRDGCELFARGLIHAGRNFDDINNVIHNMGYTGYRGSGKGYISNVYTDKSGNVITQDEFWKNFDAENGTKILPREQRKF